MHLPPLRRALPVSLLIALAGSAQAQDPPFNANLVGSFDQAGSSYADIWADPGVAYLARFGQAQVDLVDISNPASPSLITTYSLPSPDDTASAQDVKSGVIAGRNLLFVAAESSSPNGVLILDVTNPASPSLLTLVDPEPGFFEEIHNISFDDGWLYICNSANNEISIIDLNGYNPLSPPATITASTHYMTGVGTFFVHDITVQNDRMWVSGWNEMLVYDVSDLNSGPPVYMGEETGFSSHAVWPTADGQYVVTAEERSGGTLRLYKVDDDGVTVDLMPVDSYLAESVDALSSHNPLVVGDRVYSSHYQQGLTVLEIDRTSDTWEVVATYDTTAFQNTGGFDGNWGAYPFNGLDQVVLSDIDEGLFVVDTSGLQIEFVSARPKLVSPLSGAPITVEIVPVGSGRTLSGTPTLHYSVDGGAAQTVAMASIGGGQYQASLPGGLCGSTLDWWVTAMDNLGDTYADPATAPAVTHTSYSGTGTTTVLADGFETDLGWTVVDDIDLSTGTWERGTPTESGAQPGEGSRAGAGTQCFITELAASSVGSNDLDGSFTTLTSPNLDFSGGDGLISWDEWYFRSDGEDVLSVELSNNGSTWVSVQETGAKAGGWVRQTIRVSDFVTPNATVQIRFIAGDVGSGSIAEAGVDEFLAETLDCSPAAASVIRNGTGINPVEYLPVTPPAIGTAWETSIDFASYGGIVSVQTLSAGGPTSLVFGLGELLILPPDLLQTIASGTHIINIPVNPALLGQTVASQGFSFAPGNLVLFNAIDITIGY